VQGSVPVLHFFFLYLTPSFGTWQSSVLFRRIAVVFTTHCLDNPTFWYRCTPHLYPTNRCFQPFRRFLPFHPYIRLISCRYRFFISKRYTTYIFYRRWFPICAFLCHIVFHLTCVGFTFFGLHPYLVPVQRVTDARNNCRQQLQYNHTYMITLT